MFNMKRGFTIVEVSILFVIFLIVAFLVAPMSLDETLLAKNSSRWSDVQSDFNNILEAVKLCVSQDQLDFKTAFNQVMNEQIKGEAKPYKIVYMNGSTPSLDYTFDDLKLTNMNSTVAYKLNDSSQNGVLGMLMYDVNGQVGPNQWGKDIFGLNIYEDRFEPFCKNDLVSSQKQDCSKKGTGLCCSNFYLIGGSFN